MAIAFDLSVGKSRDWQAATLSSIGDAVVTTDAHDRVTFLNAVAQSLTGWAHEQALGQLWSTWRFCAGDNRRAMFADSPGDVKL